MWPRPNPSTNQRRESKRAAELPLRRQQSRRSAGNSVASNGTPHGMTIATGTVTNNGDKQSDAVTSSNPGGSSGDIQYNNAGVFGGSPNLFWDNNDGTVTITKTSNNSQSGLDVTVPTGQDNQYSIRAFTTAAHYSALTADVVIGNGVSTRDSISRFWNHVRQWD